jgi:hypothetical protein
LTFMVTNTETGSDPSWMAASSGAPERRRTTPEREGVRCWTERASGSSARSRQGRRRRPSSARSSQGRRDSSCLALGDETDAHRLTPRPRPRVELGPFLLTSALVRGFKWKNYTPLNVVIRWRSSDRWLEFAYFAC